MGIKLTPSAAAIDALMFAAERLTGAHAAPPAATAVLALGPK